MTDQQTFTDEDKQELAQKVHRKVKELASACQDLRAAGLRLEIGFDPTTLVSDMPALKVSIYELHDYPEHQPAAAASPATPEASEPGTDPPGPGADRPSDSGPAGNEQKP